METDRSLIVPDDIQLEQPAVAKSKSPDKKKKKSKKDKEGPKLDLMELDVKEIELIYQAR